MTITEVAREMTFHLGQANGLEAIGSPISAQRSFALAEDARAEIERRLAALFADGAR